MKQPNSKRSFEDGACADAIALVSNYWASPYSTNQQIIREIERVHRLNSRGEMIVINGNVRDDLWVWLAEYYSQGAAVAPLAAGRVFLLQMVLKSMGTPEYKTCFLFNENMAMDLLLCLLSESVVVGLQRQLATEWIEIASHHEMREVDEFSCDVIVEIMTAWIACNCRVLRGREMPRQESNRAVTLFDTLDAELPPAIQVASLLRQFVLERGEFWFPG